MAASSSSLTPNPSRPWQDMRAITMNNKATVYRENGDMEGAREALEASLQLARRPQAALNMCVVLSALGDHEEVH